VQVRKLIEEGAKVEFWNDQLQTPLLVASEKGRLNTLLALVYSFPLRPLENIFSLMLRHAALCRIFLMALSLLRSFACTCQLE